MLKKLVVGVFLVGLVSWLNSGLAAVGAKAERPPVMVETVTIGYVTKPEQISSTGTLLSIPGIIVKPEIAGRITKVYFKSGEIVAEGTLLVEINPDVIKAGLTSAEAELKLNQANFERAFSLHKTHDISKADFDRAQANYNSSRANVDSMRAKLQQATVTAPFAGKLGLSKVNVGEYVNVGQDLVSLQTIDPLKVDFSVPEVYQSKIAVGQTVKLRTDAYSQETFSGKVEAVESLINQNNRTLKIRAEIPNQENKLIPGGFVTVNLLFAEQSVIIIPQTAIVYAPDGSYVYKVVGGKAEKTKVELVAKDSDGVIVKSGLKPGDIVVTAGQIKLYPGAAVIVVGGKK